ncbi:MAG: hypothetical protein EU532_01960 [Promethearchaeota archaeon]|nr:MAG: hypothetical protein EU532_01960 [Candidatus Lokiarchaeota archaeon]
MESETVKNITIMEKMHKIPPIMMFPLIILAIVSIGLIFFYPSMIDFMSGCFPIKFSIGTLFCFLTNILLSIGTYPIIFLIIVGFLITYPFYFTRKISPHAILTRFLIRDVYNMLKNRWIFNPVYYLFPIGIYKLGGVMRTLHLSLNKLYHNVGIGTFKLGSFMRSFHLSLDKYYRKLAYFFRNSGELIRKFQTGKINSNLLYFIICIFLSLIIIYLMVVMN